MHTTEVGRSTFSEEDSEKDVQYDLRLDLIVRTYLNVASKVGGTGFYHSLRQKTITHTDYIGPEVSVSYHNEDGIFTWFWIAIFNQPDPGFW